MSSFHKYKHLICIYIYHSKFTIEKVDPTKLTDTENRMLVARGGGLRGVGETGEGHQEVQTNSFKVSL